MERAGGCVAGRWEIGVDTGGTFTDCLARDPHGGLHRVKVLSTSALRGTIRGVGPAGPGLTLEVEVPWQAPADFPVGFEVRVAPGPGTVDGLRSRVLSFDPGRGHLQVAPPPNDAPFAPPPGTPFELRSPEPAPLLAARLATGTLPGAPLPDLALRLATTRGTNALLERAGAPLALFATRGFGDVLELGDQQRPELFDLFPRRPPSLPRAVIEVNERITHDGNVLLSVDLDPLRAHARALVARGIRSAAVVLLHAWRNPAHEVAVAELLREEGFTHVARSSEVAPFLHYLRRAETTAVEGYLGPVVRDYVERIARVVPRDRLLVMTSAGGLVRGRGVRARDTLLSGPAGGVVGAAMVGRLSGFPRVVAFDMGGTSTDVSRHDASYTYVEEHRVGDARLRAPALAIETVAAGGGSICALGPGGLEVGPGSAGADPGPACYGAGGPLTLTDVNLLLGRVDPDRFGIPVSEAPARVAAEALGQALEARTGETTPLELLLEGCLELADARMADAIRRISVRRGYDPADHALVAFGGAGPQHACAVASRLGMRTVLVPADAGILSAVGLGHAVVERFAHREILAPLEAAAPALPEAFRELEARARAEVEAEGVPADAIEVRERTVHLRYRGQESTLDVPFELSESSVGSLGEAPHLSEPSVGSPGGGPRLSERSVGSPGEAPRLSESGVGSLAAAFETAYEEVYGHRARGRGVEVASLRVVASARAEALPPVPAPAPFPAPPRRRHRTWLGGAWQEVPVHDRADLAPGATLAGPALVTGAHSGTVVPEGWRGCIDGTGTLVLERVEAPAEDRPRARAVEEELFVERFRSLVEEMGEQLRRTSLSVNIRERLDFSCALLDPAGRLVANAPHIPVHLGALGLCVRRVAEVLDLGPGDVAVTNHPGYGGSHLPDVTVITPVFEAATRSGPRPRGSAPPGLRGEPRPPRRNGGHAPRVHAPRCSLPP
jgi:5-oxoprolinase (ATP-hydrolysing)